MVAPRAPATDPPRLIKVASAAFAEWVKVQKGPEPAAYFVSGNGKDAMAGRRIAGDYRESSGCAAHRGAFDYKRAVVGIAIGFEVNNSALGLTR
jgi:hypothetical protein